MAAINLAGRAETVLGPGRHGGLRFGLACMVHMIIDVVSACISAQMHLHVCLVVSVARNVKVHRTLCNQEENAMHTVCGRKFWARGHRLDVLHVVHASYVGMYAKNG